MSSPNNTEKQDSEYVVLVKIMSIAISCVIVALIVLSGILFNRIGILEGKLDAMESSQIQTIGDSVSTQMPGLTEVSVDSPKGGTATITTSDGEIFTYNIPEDHYNITSSYLATVAQVYGVASVSAPNLIITGDGPSVTDSKGSINASTFSNTKSIYSQIFGQDFDSLPDESVYSPAYEYILNGEIPESADDSYTVKEFDAIEKDGVTYRVVSVDYDTDYTEYEDADGNTIEEPEMNIVHTHNLSAYSDTNDTIELIAYTADNDTDVEYQMLKDFIGVN